jgi:hypothetical protein
MLQFDWLKIFELDCRNKTTNGGSKKNRLFINNQIKIDVRNGHHSFPGTIVLYVTNFLK